MPRPSVFPCLVQLLAVALAELPAQPLAVVGHGRMYSFAGSPLGRLRPVAMWRIHPSGSF